MNLIRPRYEALDGLRGVAILMVFLNHYGPLCMPAWIAHMLWPGVDLFFVLSGFLITGILFDSRERVRYFRNFYIRRSLRIFPLYYLFFLVIAIFHSHLRYERSMWSHLFYIANFSRFWAHNPTVIFYGSSFIGLGALWSLSVEEQFYLAWPLLVWLLPTRRAMMTLCAGGALAALVLRTLLYFHSPAKVAITHYLYFVTYARCDTLLIGAWLALWLRGTDLSLSQVRRIAYSLIASCGAILIVGAVTIGRRWPANEVNPLLCTYGYTLIALVAFGVLLLALDTRTLFYRALKFRPLRSLGVISYGFYFFHALWLPYVIEFNTRHMLWRHLGFLTVLGSFAFTAAVATLSFHLVESPFLRLKHYFAPSHRSVPSGYEKPEELRA